MIALFIERKIWLHNPFTAFALFDKLFTPFFLFYGFVLIPIYSLMRMDWFIFVGWIVWLHFSRFLKLVLHIKRVPLDIFYLTIWIVYQYLMAFIRIYALFTMLQTQWGNRAVSVVHNQVTRTGEFALQVIKMGQVADEEQGKDDDSSGEVWDKVADEEQGKDDDDHEVWDKEDKVRQQIYAPPIEFPPFPTVVCGFDASPASIHSDITKSYAMVPTQYNPFHDLRRYTTCGVVYEEEEHPFDEED